MTDVVATPLHDENGDRRMFYCPEPGCTHVSPNPQGLGAHRRRVHGTTGKSASASAERKSTAATRKRHTETERLAIAVQALYPSGIKTNDMGELLAALALVDAMREVVSRERQ